ncbi:MAG: DUF2330 domain-containing protein [Deltaproteobacteria bacterium]|nr:MAG: DUF2330 domain-containing protein [Deltaproteobacteria bacterium]
MRFVFVSSVARRSLLPLASFALALLARPNPADACGCLSPPVVTEGDYAVNQSAEQIIFEVGESTVTAHVLIRYQGDPAQFAWIVPVPNQPQLDLSETLAFGLLESATRPSVDPSVDNVCPGAAYRCAYHDDPCYPGDSGDWGTGGGFVGPQFDAGQGGGEDPDGVDVLDMQVVGDYETVTFAASDAALAVQWLQDNGFVVNDTMTPYMQPYIDAGMVFVAAKLVAGAGLDAIKPLKMTYQGTTPMIPLQLTAVATEPHLTVTAYIYSKTYFYEPIDHPVTDIDPTRLTVDPSGRINYPMVLARTIDDAGRDAFVIEYAGSPPNGNPRPDDDPSGCCSSDSDICNLASNGQCECPASAFDMADCAEIPGLVEGAELLASLQADYFYATRLTTRLSAEEMTFDPAFQPAPNREPVIHTFSASRKVLEGCEADVLDTAAAGYVDAIEACSAVYCDHGTCVATEDGPGCACDAGYVARAFVDLDGKPSVTCVPSTPPVILDKDVDLPDPCAGVDCGPGASCVDLGGFAACACGGAFGAVAPGEANGPLVPTCKPITATAGSPGAEDFSAARAAIPVCFAEPPTCGTDGWLEPLAASELPANGVFCNGSMPDPEDLVPPPAPDPDSCDGPQTSGAGTSSTGSTGATGDTGAAGGSKVSSGCACRADGPASPWSLGLLVALWGRRRRRA